MGLESIWNSLSDRALAGDQKSILEVLRLSNVPRGSSEGETERTDELSDADYELLEDLPEDLQDLCVQHHMSPTAIWKRRGRKLPLSDDETLVAEALEEFDDEDD